MPHYKVRRVHPDWLREDSTEGDERSRTLVEELNRKLTEQRAATDVSFEASKPGYGVWLRIDADRNPLVALAGIGRAACRHPWRGRSVDDTSIHDTVLGHISKADLSGCQMHYQILRAIFKGFFSQLRLLRPVAMLHLAGCGLTQTCAQLFPWCAVNLELTRLDVSNNPELSFKEDSPMAELDLQGFSSFVRRSVYLEALQIHHTGFSNPQLISMCDLLGTMGKDKLKHISIGPPRDPIVSADGCQLQSVPFSDDCLAAIASMLKTLGSLDLVVIHGLSPEQTEALCAAVPSRLHTNTSDGCLRLSSASRDAVEWAEFGPVELDERLLIQPGLHTMDAEAGDEHLMQQNGKDELPAAALARAPGKLHVREHAHQTADPFARAHAVRHPQPRRRHRRRPQSGGQRRIRPDAERQVRRRRKRRPAAGNVVDDAAGVAAVGEGLRDSYAAFVDDAAGVAAVGEGLRDSYAAFVDDAAGVAAVGVEVIETYAARAVGSGSEHSLSSCTSEGSEASSDGDLNSEDAYPEEDWAALKQAAAGAACTDALSDDSLSEQEPELRAERPQHDAHIHQQAISPRQGDLVAKPDQEHTPGGHAHAGAVCATGLASPRTPRRRSRKKQKRSRMTEELEDLNPWPTENPESAEKHPAKGIFARVEGPRRRTQDVLSDQVRAMQARLHGHEPGSNTIHARQEPSSPTQDPALPDTLMQQPSDIEKSSQSEEASQGGQSLGGEDIPGTAGPGAAKQRQFMLQDSEEQDAMQQPRPGSGAPRPILLLDSEEQDGLPQPDRTETPDQHIIQIFDSEKNNPADQPAEASLPGPCLEGDGSAHAAAGCGRPASEAAATGAVSHQERAPVRETQTEGEFEAGIAHLPAKMQRELRGLQRPWHFDARLAEHPVNMARFRPEHAKRQTRQPERFKFEGPSMGDGHEGQSPTGQSTEADESDTASEEDELPLLDLVKRSVSPAAAVALPVAGPWDGAAERASQEEAASKQPSQPVDPPDTILPLPTPAETHKGHDQSKGQCRDACNDDPEMLAVSKRAPSTDLEAEMLGATGMQAWDSGSPSPSAQPAGLRDDTGAMAQESAETDSYPTSSSASDDAASDGAGGKQAAPNEDPSASTAMLQAQHIDRYRLEGGQPAASEAAWQPEGRTQQQSRKLREAKRLALFPSDRQREKNPPNEDRFLPRGKRRPRQPPAWLDFNGTTSAKEVQHPGEGPQPIALVAVPWKDNAPPAACPMEGGASPADTDMGAKLRLDLIPDSEDEA